MKLILFVILVAGYLLYLLKTSYENYLESEPTVTRLKRKLLPSFPELAYIKMMKGDSSYTINKQKIYLCTEANGKTYDDNMLTYVILHELAHTMCPEVGHGKTFQRIFQMLLTRAEMNELFDPAKPRTENYCKTKKL